MTFAKTWSFISQHPLTRNHRLSALARYIKWQVTCRLRSDVEIGWIDGVRVLARRGMTGFTGNIYCGLHEFADMAFLLHLLRPGDTFVDIGANVGSYSLLASGVCAAKTIAFEPDPGTARALRRNLEINGLQSHVEVHEMAVGDTDGQIDFKIGRDTTNQVAETPGSNTRRLPIGRLDSIAGARNAVLVKIDVEGYEEHVMAGAEGVLSQASLLAVKSEGQQPLVLETLARHGFTPAYYDPFKRALSTCPAAVSAANGLFVRDWPAVQARVAAAPRRRVLDAEI